MKNKLSKTFKFLKWIYILSAILAFMAIVITATGNGVTATNLIFANITIIVNSLLLAFVFGRTKIEDGKQ